MRSVLYASLITLISISVEAQQIDFEASVDRTRFPQSDPLRLTLRITSDESIPHIPSPEITLNGFHVEGPSVSTRMEMVNFNTTFMRELTYVLYASRTGSLEIGPAKINIDGKIYTTNTLVVEVVPVSKGNGASNDGGGSFSIEDHLYLQARVDRLQAYVGQQITIDFDLYYRVQLHNVRFKQIPSFVGFWNKELFVAQQLQARREVIEGISFNVAPLRSMSLFPTHAGLHTIDPMIVLCDVPAGRSQRRGLLDDFFSSDPFFGRSQSTIVQSDSVQIKVLPLPEIGRPTQFSGAVGRFSISAELQPIQVPVGDPVTLRVEVFGEGNLFVMKDLNFIVPEGFKQYEPTIEDEENIVKGVFGGRRIMEFILIPNKVGEFEIPPIEFNYFDPFTERYVVGESQKLNVDITGEEGTGEKVITYGLRRSDIEQVGNDIRYIKPDAVGLEQFSPVYMSFGFWLFQGAAPLIFGGVLIFRRYRLRLHGDLAYAREKRAFSDAIKRLNKADEFLSSSDSASFYAEIQRALYMFIGDKLNVSVVGMTVEECEHISSEAGLSSDLIELLGMCLRRCNYARFGQAAGTISDMQDVRRDAEKLIESLR